MALTEQEQIWINALLPVAKKAKLLGWTLPKEPENKIFPCGIWQFVLLDPQKKKHWIRVSATGCVYFAAVTFVGNGICGL